MSKNIVVCCDGTQNEYSKCNSNIVKLYSFLERNNNQVTFYDPGVGTISTDIFGRFIGSKIGMLLGSAFGYGLTENIEDAYEYIMNRYEPGDRLYLFGFSRGAFTVRALAGMLHKVGILQKGSVNLIPYASKIYNTRNNDDIAKGFKETFSHECKLHFIGVFDTVASLGYFFGKKFFNAKLNPDVKYAYQAISIDEHRKKFPISLWNEETKNDNQIIEQVWFAGSHSDVGGGYKEDEASDFPLSWMLSKAEKCGLKLTGDYYTDLAPSTYSPILHESRTGFWKLWKEVKRKIPEGAKIHFSVLHRKKLDRNYKVELPNKYTEAHN